MKILAAVMDVAFVKTFHTWPDFRKRTIVTKTKRFLVYDPRKVTPCHYQKKENDDASN